MKKKWYIVQLIAGYEEKVKDEILKRIQEQGLQDQFGDVLVPEVRASGNFFNQLSSSSIEQLFPGYMLVSLIPSVENFRLVTTIYRVIRFLGGEFPSELSQQEVDRILSQVNGSIAISSPDVLVYSVGDHVDIIEGPFNGFSGVVNSIDEQKQKIVVMISIFNRLTPIEILFNQAKK
jgi:transcriptional antiterminator NusG